MHKSGLKHKEANAAARRHKPGAGSPHMLTGPHRLSNAAASIAIAANVSVLGRLPLEMDMDDARHAVACIYTCTYMQVPPPTTAAVEPAAVSAAVWARCASAMMTETTVAVRSLAINVCRRQCRAAVFGLQYHAIFVNSMHHHRHRQVPPKIVYQHPLLHRQCGMHETLRLHCSRLSLPQFLTSNTQGLTHSVDCAGCPIPALGSPCSEECGCPTGFVCDDQSAQCSTLLSEPCTMRTRPGARDG